MEKGDGMTMATRHRFKPAHLPQIPREWPSELLAAFVVTPGAYTSQGEKSFCIPSGEFSENLARRLAFSDSSVAQNGVLMFIIPESVVWESEEDCESVNTLTDVKGTVFNQVVPKLATTIRFTPAEGFSTDPPCEALTGKLAHVYHRGTSESIILVGDLSFKRGCGWADYVEELYIPYRPG